MKRLILFVVCSLCLLLAYPMRVSAVTVPGPGVSSQSPNGDSDSNETVTSIHYHDIVFDDGTKAKVSCNHKDCTPETFKPKLTALHSVNAIVAGSEEYNGVYYLPTLSDIPVDLVDLCSDVQLTGDDGKISSRHTFAYVYDGYFDAEVQFEQPRQESYKVGSAQTSKRVWSSTDSSRLLNIVGYDMLLRSESYTLAVNGETGNIDITYAPSLVGYADLTMDVIVMDLYKALGQFEYDFDIAWGRDYATFGNTKSSRISGLSSSPLLRGVTYLVDDIDVSEVKTYLAVTRTNPALYWERFERDGICNGGLHTYTSNIDRMGAETSVSKVYSNTSRLTGAEFCNIARALMTLYGEPVVTEHELLVAEQAYSIQFPQGRYTEEVYNSVMYLIAKGILDPLEMDFDSYVTFADIEHVLLRIADPNSRIQTEAMYNVRNPLATRGYAMAESVSLLDDAVSISITDTGMNAQFDILVEVVPGVNTLPYSKDITDAYNWSSTGFIYGTQEPDKSSTPGFDATAIGINGNYYSLQGVKKLVIPDTGETRSFYHFKIGVPELSELGFTDLRMTTNSSDTSSSLAADKPIILGSEYNGGVWLYAAGKGFTRHSFSEMHCSSDYVDKDSVNFAGKLSSSKIVVVLAPASYITQDFLDQASRNDNMDFTSIAATGYHQVAAGISCSTLSLPSNGVDCIRFEFTCTDNYQSLVNSNFLRDLNRKSGVVAESAKGFYRSSTNTLLVSADYLKNEGSLSGYKKLDSGGYLLLSSDHGVNVTISDRMGYIMVGNTLYPTNGEDLYYEDNGELYVNYKACIGWTGDILVLPGNKDQVVAMKRKLSNASGTDQEVEYQMKDVKTYFASASTRVLKLTTYDWGNSRVPTNSGISLAGNYVLSPYLLVMADDNGYDYLFVYHRRGMRVDGIVVDSDAQAGDSDARSKFTELTGIRLDASNDFYLVMYPLQRNGGSLPGGLKLLTNVSNESYMAGVTSTLGYICELPVCDDVAAAVKEYAKGNSAQYVLPIIDYCPDGRNHKYYDVNVNVFKRTESSDYDDVGVMPYVFYAKSQTSNTCRITKTGYCTQQLADTVDLSSIVVYAAPAGIWGQLQLISKDKLSNLKSSSCTMYYGTQRVSKSNDGITILGRKTSISSDSEAFCTYFGSYGSSVYVSYATHSTIGSLVDLQALEDEISVIAEDPNTVIDWAQYKFSRLVENADKFSTILLIFILNVMPRITIMMFMVIILLALIKDVKPWKVFNQRCFDVYKFLTFGHSSVDDVNYKRVLFTSIIALALSFMIMDGTFWNVIMYVAKAILYLQQH